VSAIRNAILVRMNLSWNPPRRFQGYTPLDKTKDQIRLLSIRNNEHLNAVEMNLDTFDVQDCPDTKLSATRRVPKMMLMRTPTYIYLHDQPLPVPRNLHGFLTVHMHLQQIHQEPFGSFSYVPSIEGLNFWGPFVKDRREYMQRASTQR
jgi:hypothetical protein